MDLRLLNTFVQAARLESFTDAGRVLQISPAAVSQNIKSLENELAVRLFTRTTRKVRLTHEGKSFLNRCQPALDALDEAVSMASDEGTNISGTIRISSTTAFGRSHVIPIISDFIAHHPGVHIELQLTDGFVDLVSEEVDMAIRAGVLPENEYVSRLLLPVTPIACASPEYFARHGKPEKPADLKRHSCIGMISNQTKRVFEWEFKSGSRMVKQKINPILTVNDPEAMALAVLNGSGIGQLGTNLALTYLKEGKLETVLEDYAVSSRGIYLVYPTRRYVTSRVRLFMDYLIERLAPLKKQYENPFSDDR